MSYAGHTADMINRYRANRELLRANKERIGQLKEKLMDSPHYKANDYSDKKVPPEVMAKIKAEIRREIRRHRIFSRSLSVSVTLILLAFLIWTFIHFYNISEGRI